MIFKVAFLWWHVQELKEWETVRAEKIARLAYQKELFLSSDFGIPAGGADRALLIQERLVVSKKWFSDNGETPRKASQHNLNQLFMQCILRPQLAKRDAFFVITFVLSHYFCKPNRCNKMYQMVSFLWSYFPELQTLWSQGRASMKPIEVRTSSYTQSPTYRRWWVSNFPLPGSLALLSWCNAFTKQCKAWAVNK